MKHKGYEITTLDLSGILSECGVEIGDVILSVNDRPFWDDLDALYAETQEELKLEIEKKSGEIVTLEIEKDIEESLGLPCDGSTLGIRRCTNDCVFCFIDQMPPGMRETLYVKDDDERLSFLQGNYVTLTNLSPEMKQRIVDYRMMPLNISVHTTDPALRCRMLNNRFAGGIMDDLKYFSDNYINMNAQIVLCPGYNDGEHLEKTLNDLASLYPALETVSVVPVGLTDYREGLAELTPVVREKAIETLQIIEKIQTKMWDRYETRFVFPGDELFLLAQRSIPDADYYENFTQLENGVGMLADFKAGLTDALDQICHHDVFDQNFKKEIAIVTGKCAETFMNECAAQLMRSFPELQIAVVAVENKFFGSKITVSGLVTGGDLIEQFPKNHHFDVVYIPENMVRYHTEDFLDDVTLEEAAAAIGSPLQIIAVDGAALVNAIIGR